MRYLIPLENDQGPQSRVSPHFGRAPFYAIVSYEPGIDARIEIRSAPGLMHGGGCGATDLIRRLEVDVVIVKGIGIRAIQALREMDVRIYKTSSETLDQVVREIRERKVTEVSDQEACEGRRGGLATNL